MHCIHQTHNLATSSGEVVMCGGGARIEQENCGGRINAFTVVDIGQESNPVTSCGTAAVPRIGRSHHLPQTMLASREKQLFEPIHGTVSAAQADEDRAAQSATRKTCGGGDGRRNGAL